MSCGPFVIGPILTGCLLTLQLDGCCIAQLTSALGSPKCCNCSELDIYVFAYVKLIDSTCSVSCSEPFDADYHKAVPKVSSSLTADAVSLAASHLILTITKQYQKSRISYLFTAEEMDIVPDRHRSKAKHGSLVQPLARNVLNTPLTSSAANQVAVSKQQQTAADVAAAAGAVAAAAALQVIHAAGEQVQAQLQVFVKLCASVVGCLHAASA